MQFFALILVNTAMFAIFYLLISLKLERKATEFREKKLRRIMEEMIGEFNETAERNITLLESKIQVMKRMMQASGSIKGLGLSITDKMEVTEEEISSVSGAAPADLGGPNRVNTFEAIKSVLSGGAGAISRGIRKIAEKTSHKGGAAFPDNYAGQSMDPEFHPRCKDIPREGLPGAPDVPEDREAAHGDDSKDLSAIFDGAGDKYALISDLYARGYSVEDLSRSSGIPQGEIRLVLNLGM